MNDRPNDRPVVLQHGRLLPALEAALAERYELLPLWQQPEPAAWLREHGGRVRALATSAGVGADRALIDALPRLEMVSSFGVGLDQLDLDALRRRGLKAGYTPDVLNDCVADTAFTLLLDVARGASAADRFVRRGGWLSAKFPLATKFSGKRLGILGLGRIGRAIARRAAGFDMTIRYTNRSPALDVPWPYEPALVELARWADFLVIAAAGGADSRHLVDDAVLDALGPQGFVVNIARGSVIDEAALVRALVDKRIGGAGLDVFENEPAVPPALFALDNVVLLPHVASATVETRQAMADRVLANLEAHFAGQPLPSPVPGLGA